jgi:hypothetical protein
MFTVSNNNSEERRFSKLVSDKGQYEERHADEVGHKHRECVVAGALQMHVHPPRERKSTIAKLVSSKLSQIAV